MQRKLFSMLIIVALFCTATLFGRTWWQAALAQKPAPAGAVETQALLGTAFTYQGQIKKGGVPVNGQCDLQFSLFDAASAGTQIGSVQTLSNVAVADGRFSVQLDFGGSAFNGAARWLLIAARCPAGSGSYATLSPRQALTAVPYALSLRPGAKVSGANSSAELAGTGVGVSGSGAIGVQGVSTGSNGVYGKSSAALASGVYGENSGGGYGVAGRSSGGHGVFGDNTGNGNGVYGQSSTGYGVYGYSANYGVYGRAAFASGLFPSVPVGVWGDSDSGVGVTGTSAGSNGVYGKSSAALASGVYGENSGGGIGVAGRADGNYPALFGENFGGGNGVTGRSDGGHGVFGESVAGGGIGVVGDSTGSGLTRGVYGQANGYSSRGVEGYSTYGYGVYGASQEGFGVYGINTNGVGVFAESTGGTALFVEGHDQQAARFYGNVDIRGNTFVIGAVEVEGLLTALVKLFKIDHPLDPANQYLQHAAVEAPELKTFYDGVVTTDGHGDATIVLPDYFEALNRDFRYQLTVIGQFAQAMVASEIVGNRFTIKTDKPNVKVSWQVTGVRRDAYAIANPLQVEVEKSASERGKYLTPAAFGLPETMRVGYDEERRAEQR